MVIMEVNLAQQLAFMEQCPLSGLFLDLRKAYGAMDRGRCLQILEDSGVRPKTRQLIKCSWDKNSLVCRAAGYYSRPFKAGRIVTQGEPVSPATLNLTVHTFICEWERLLVIKCIPLGEIRGILIAVFCADDGPPPTTRRFFRKQ